MNTAGPGFLRVAITVLLLAAAMAGCGGSDSIVITVRDQDNRPVEGVEVRLAGGGERLGVTDATGHADVKPPRQEGESLIRLVPPTGGESWVFEPSYRITGDEFRNGKKFIRARAGNPNEEMTGRLQVSSEPTGAVIYLNGAVAGTTDVVLRNLAPGLTKLSLSREGMLSDTTTVFVERGENPGYHVVLIPAEVTTASLSVTSDPSGASVFLDGRNTGQKTPATFTELKPGRYRVKISLAGYRDLESSVTLQKGKQGFAGGALEKPRPRDTASSGGDGGTRTGGTGRTTPPSGGGDFSRSYIVSAAPRWAEIYVDGDPVNKNITGNFRITLTEGSHSFRVVNNQAGINRVLTYEVKSGDSNGKLIMNYETGRVVARP